MAGDADACINHHRHGRLLIMISSIALVSSPWLEPIGAPSGITAAQPTSSSRLHSTGSAPQ
jgi:hypothetical protein